MMLSGFFEVLLHWYSWAAVLSEQTAVSAPVSVAVMSQVDNLKS